jgi:hypothetical protein
MASPDVRRQVREFLAQQEAEILRTVALDLRVYSLGSRPDIGPFRAEFEAEGAELVFAAGLSALPGRRASVMGGDAKNYIADYDVEVAQESRIADPIIGQSFDGVVANLTPNPSHDRSHVDLSVELLISHRTRDEPVDTGAQYLGPVDRITEKRTVINTDLAIPVGSEYRLDAGPDPRDPSGNRRLVVTIRPRLK